MEVYSLAAVAIDLLYIIALDTNQLSGRPELDHEPGSCKCVSRHRHPHFTKATSAIWVTLNRCATVLVWCCDVHLGIKDVKDGCVE